MDLNAPLEEEPLDLNAPLPAPELDLNAPLDESPMGDFGGTRVPVEDFQAAGAAIENIAPNILKNVGTIASMAPAALTSLGQGSLTHLSAIDKVMGSGVGDLTPEEKEAFFKTDLPLAIDVGTAVMSGGSSIIPRVALNAALPWAVRQLGRKATGEEMTQEGAINDAFSSIPQATAAATTFLPAWARIPASMAAGEVRRQHFGEERTPGRVLLDTLDPAWFSVARNTREAVRRAGTSLRNLPGAEEATALETSLRPYEEVYGNRGLPGGLRVPSTMVTPEELASTLPDAPHQIQGIPGGARVPDLAATLTPQQRARNLVRNFLGRDPITSGQLSTNPLQQEQGGRLYHATDEGMRFEGELRARAQQIRQSVEGLADPHEVGYLTDYRLGKSHLDVEGPLLPDQTRPWLAGDPLEAAHVGPPTADFFRALANPQTREAAGLSIDTQRRLRQLGERLNIFPPNAPPLEGYAGPLVPREDTAAGRELLRSQTFREGERTETLGAALGPEEGWRKRLAPHQRAGEWTPGAHVGDPRARIDAWANMYVPAYEAAAAFGPKSTGSAAGAFRTAADVLERQHVAAPYAEDLGLPREFSPSYAEAADHLQGVATDARTVGSEDVQQLADDFRRRAQLGFETDGEQLAEELRQRARDLEANPRPDDSKAMGRNAMDLIARTREGNLSARELRTQERLEGGMKQYYNREPEGGWERDLFRAASRGISTGLLGQAGMGQINQIASNIFRPGFGRSWQGQVRSMLDPGVDEMMRSSRAGVSPFVAHHHSLTEEGANVLGDAEDVVGSQMAYFENINREKANKGLVPYVEDTIRDQNAGVRTPAQARKMMEMGLAPDRDHELTYTLMQDAIRRLTGRQQFLSTRPGFSPNEMISSATGRTISQYMPYARSQSTMVWDDILNPIARGVSHPIRNRSELSEGLDRLLRYAPAVAATTTIAKGVKDIATGDIINPDKDWGKDYGERLLAKGAENAAGFYGKVGVNVGGAIWRTLQGKAGAQDYMNALVSPFVPPAMSLPQRGSAKSIGLAAYGTFADPGQAAWASVYGPALLNLGQTGLAAGVALSQAPDDDQSTIERPAFQPQAGR